MFRPVGPADPPPLIYTATGAPGSARDSLSGVDLGGRRIIKKKIDVGLVVADLAGRGAGVVLAEGRPSLNHQWVAAGLVDELNLTISPLLVGGTAKRILSGPTLAAPAGLRLDRVLSDDGYLFCRYLLG
jgi:riboflavin biosynthesis pyrimidine reductase